MVPKQNTFTKLTSIILALLLFTFMMFCSGYAKCATPEEAKWLNASDIQRIGYNPDLTGDGVVSVDDLNFIVSSFGKNSLLDKKADLNKDGIVNIVDLVLISKYFGWSVDTITPIIGISDQFISNITYVKVSANEPLKKDASKWVLYDDKGGVISTGTCSAEVLINLGKLREANYVLHVSAKDLAGNPAEQDYKFKSQNPTDRFAIGVSGAHYRPDGVQFFMNDLAKLGYNETLPAALKQKALMDDPTLEQHTATVEEICSKADYNDELIYAWYGNGGGHGEMELNGIYQGKDVLSALKAFNGGRITIFMDTCYSKVHLDILAELGIKNLVAYGSTDANEITKYTLIGYIDEKQINLKMYTVDNGARDISNTFRNFEEPSLAQMVITSGAGLITAKIEYKMVNNVLQFSINGVDSKRNELFIPR